MAESGIDEELAVELAIFHMVLSLEGGFVREAKLVFC